MTFARRALVARWRLSQDRRNKPQPDRPQERGRPRQDLVRPVLFQGMLEDTYRVNPQTRVYVHQPAAAALYFRSHKVGADLPGKRRRVAAPPQRWYGPIRTKAPVCAGVRFPNPPPAHPRGPIAKTLSA